MVTPSSPLKCPPFALSPARLGCQILGSYPISPSSSLFQKKEPPIRHGMCVEETHSATSNKRTGKQAGVSFIFQKGPQNLEDYAEADAFVLVHPKRLPPRTTDLENLI